jgi:hypothetical protein
MNAFLVDSQLSVRSKLITQSELENQNFVHGSRLEDVKLEISSLRQNETQNTKQEVELLARELDALQTQLVERVVGLKSDMSLELNQHKSDTKEVAKSIDLGIQQVQHKLVIKLADMKTLIETMKVELTTDIVWMTVLTMGGILAFDWMLKKPDRKELQESDL